MLGGRQIPQHELQIVFVRSSGPGGQNVNKTSTKAQLHWDLERSSVFSADEKRRIRHYLRNRITNDGEVVIAASDERRQSANKATAVERLHHLIDLALTPEKKRVATKPTKASEHRRLQNKKIRSRVKQLRRSADE